MTPPEHPSYFGRRESDHLVDHRLDKLENIVEKLTENQAILTRIELNGQENSRALVECKNRLNKHGEALDEISVKVENAKVLLAGFPEAKEYNEVFEKVRIHHAAIIGAVAVMCLGVLGKVVSLI